MPIERKKIVKSYLILCEGKDAENFLINYLESEALSSDKRFSNEIQVLDFGGNDDLEKFLKNLKNMDHFDQLRSLAIIRDAEKDYSKACQEVVSSLRQSNYISSLDYGKWAHNDMGLNIGFLLFPLNKDAGTLEDLCLQILSEKNGTNILSFIDEFLSKMKSFYGGTYNREHKNKLYTYLSSSNKYVSMPLGIAAKAGAFDWDNKYLLPLKNFLTKGFDI